MTTDKIVISERQLTTICRAFHKWFRVGDCKDNADIDMYKAIAKLDDEDYMRAMIDSLKEADVKVIDFDFKGLKDLIGDFQKKIDSNLWHMKQLTQNVEFELSKVKKLLDDGDDNE